MIAARQAGSPGCGGGHGEVANVATLQLRPISVGLGLGEPDKVSVGVGATPGSCTSGVTISSLHESEKRAIGISKIEYRMTTFTCIRSAMLTRDGYLFFSYLSERDRSDLDCGGASAASGAGTGLPFFRRSFGRRLDLGRSACKVQRCGGASARGRTQVHEG